MIYGVHASVHSSFYTAVIYQVSRTLHTHCAVGASPRFPACRVGARCTARHIHVLVVVHRCILQPATSNVLCFLLIAQCAVYHTDITNETTERVAKDAASTGTLSILPPWRPTLDSPRSAPKKRNAATQYLDMWPRTCAQIGGSTEHATMRHPAVTTYAPTRKSTSSVANPGPNWNAEWRQAKAMSIGTQVAAHGAMALAAAVRTSTPRVLFTS